MNKRREIMWLLATTILAILLVSFSLSYLATEPWHILPDMGGDGAKNNFTYLYQCMYGKGYWYDGMNYPFGEHIVYTDGMPILSVLQAAMGHLQSGPALAILWLSIALSYVLCMVYTYLTLMHFKVARWAAIVFAGFITVFTPQVIRLQSHYALAFICMLPMTFYWSIQYYETAKRKYLLYIFVIGIIMAFIHPYFAALMLIWVGCYALGYFATVRRPLKEKLLHVCGPFVALAGVLGTVGAVMKLTDPVTDRPGAPLMSFDTATHIKHLITSSYSPLWVQIHKWGWVPAISEREEGYTYPGVVVLLVTVMALTAAVVRWFRNRGKANAGASNEAIQPIWPFMAIAALLFSMGVPFIWNLDWVLSYLSFFRQFRSLGRFSWIFYYVITVYAVVKIYGLYARLLLKGKKALAYSIVALCLGVWTYEASGYVAFTHRLAREGAYNYDFIFMKNEQSWSSFLEQHHFKGSDFQAVMLLPYFHIGTEKLWVGDPGWLMTLGTRVCMAEHLPMFNVMMSRSSWGQAMQQVKTLGGPQTEKHVLSLLNNNKPFLVLRTEGDSIDRDQRYLLQASDYIGNFSQCRIFACYPDRIRANDKRYTDSIAAILPSITSADTCLNGTGILYVNHLEHITSRNTLFGKGVAMPIHARDSVLFDIPVMPQKDSVEYELSAWFLLGSKDFASPYLTIQMLDSAGNIIAQTDALTKASRDNYGMWFRGNIYFPLKGQTRRLKCTLVNDPDPSYLLMDELVLRPADATIISRIGDAIMVNNHRFVRK